MSIEKKSFLPRMRQMSHIHFIGIGGNGMSGIAEVLINQGYVISGSDLLKNDNTSRLEKLGAKIQLGHTSKNLGDADVVVTSSAIPIDNPEATNARQLRIPVIPRAEMLSELMRYRHSIAVAGTHGKTTTTSLLAAILAADGKDPTFIIGGLVKSVNTNAKLGVSPYLVAEADESDASFLHLQPMVAILTNIDSDHMESYDFDFSKLKQTFLRFLHNLPFYGLAILCIDDPEIKSILSDVSRPIITYGFSKDADYRIKNVNIKKDKSSFDLLRPGIKKSLNIDMNIPGIHNILNATAAIAAASDEDVSDEAIKEGLAKFQGVARRFEVYGEYPTGKGSAMLIDDYGHHPRELAATIKAIRDGWPKRRLVMIFQPHRYTRTRDLFEDFVQVLSSCDVLFLLEVYAAGEDEIPGADSRTLCRSIRQRGLVDPIFIKNIQDVQEVLRDVIQANDIVITQGAGNINKLVRILADSNLS
ncbi:MAG: UDP-N-acetylmuramate--L-alanine ligase [Porticoccus sp.]|jgi:UDP-N-acetylmuramate--alanine ligase|nr:UDP-N-acetylmuramate--L-alanine ligase [Porticoccus sp.]